MKKKIIILLLLVLSVSVVTACGKEKPKKEETKTITLQDDKKGYKTTFTYPKTEKYSEPTKEESGASSEIDFENEEKDVEFQMYYNTITDKSYETSKEGRSKQKYYKEVKAGKYEGYVYGEYSSGLYAIFKLEENKDGLDVLLFVTIDRLDTNEDIVVADVFDKELKDFFNSMKFERIK